MILHSQRCCRAALLAVLLCPSAQAAETGSAVLATLHASSAERVREQMRPFEVSVNGAKAGAWVFADRAGALYAPQEAFDEWRVKRDPKAMSIEVFGSPYFAIASVPGFQARIDNENQSIELFFSAEAFAATRLMEERRPKLVLDPTLTSGFFNYDLSYSHSEFKAAPAVQSLGMLGELGYSSGYGVLSNSFVGRNLSNDHTLGGKANWARLETSFIRNFPEDRRTLRVGDSVTRLGMLGRQAYFGGLQFGSNYVLNPGFVTQPQPVISGLSSAPSTVELYVNDVLRQVSSVPTGPFALENLPVLSGNGEARLVVRDLLGRETVIRQSFFTNPKLLASGLNDWSLAAGRLRRNLGTTDSSYATSFGSAIWRRGWDDQLTLEGQAELTSALRRASLGLVSALPWQVLGQAAVSASRSSDGGSGRQWLLGFEKSGPSASASLQAQGASERFRQLGLELPAARLQMAGNMNYLNRTLGSFGLGFAQIHSHATATQDRQRITTATANYATKVSERVSLSLLLSKVVSGPQGTALAATLVIPLDNRVISTAAIQVRDGSSDLLVTASKNQDQDQPVSWRLLAGRQNEVNRIEGGLYYTGRYGQISGDLSSSSTQTTLRLGSLGALVVAENTLFASQRLDDSFALVELAGHPDVGVGLGSSLLTRTDSKGLALLPRLVPYQNNSVRLEAADVPLSAELDSIEKIVVPRQRSAVKVVFPARVGRAALLRIVFDDGEPAPAGATVSLAGQSEVFYTARRGEAFVTGLQATNQLELR
jgi:outer membrane usher protein